MIKKNDIILIGSIVLLAVILIVMLNITRSAGGNVLITVDGKEYKTVDLNTNATIDIKNKNGDENTIIIENGVVKMTEANCPDMLCVKHKKIQYNHESIVCLPHKVVVEIIGGEENEVDITAK